MGVVSAVLIVANEEKRIEACLLSLDGVDEIVVVDGESKDRTLEIAGRYTQKLYRRPFDHFANQKNYAIAQATGDWVLSIDADEVVSPELRKSLCGLAREGSECDGFYVRRTNFIFGRPLGYGGQRSEKILRFFRKGKGKFEQPIHERLIVKGRIGELPGALLHYGTPSIEDYLKKLSLYTDFEARWLAERGIRPTGFDLWLKPTLRFFYYYILRLGFLDGYEGFLYHSLSSFYQILKYSRLMEIYGQDEKA